MERSWGCGSRRPDPAYRCAVGLRRRTWGQGGQSVTGGELLLGGGLTCGGGARRVGAERRGGGRYDLVWLRDGKARCREGRAFKLEGQRSRRGAAEGNPGDLGEFRARALRCGGDGPGGWGHGVSGSWATRATRGRERVEAGVWSRAAAGRAGLRRGRGELGCGERVRAGWSELGPGKEWWAAGLGCWVGLGFWVFWAGFPFLISFPF